MSEGGSALSGKLETVSLSVRQTLYEDGSPADVVYFPIDCVVSVVTTMNDGSAIETATVGHEGMCGAQVALGSSEAFGRWFCQIPGRAYKMSVADFLRGYESEERWRSTVGRYLQAVIDVLSQSVACNRLHLVSERCARWLLMSADRVRSDDFPLTHEALATMLGVRRAGVSVAAAALQAAGYLSYRRGRFHMIDKAGLEQAACECYAVTRAIYDRRLATTTT
ncbi:MAG: Crp/Fnr family transcriptional regulator [Candidatus Lustribacter sp.]|jgi:CRP-like cAMP-binding protein